ncbi:unnamed protein product [Allacma fusca]|uniref:Epididymal secretory protein E1 n=1 Tax=Allacma fusca TaxID=39272 RepID=A0A8J2JQ97_9HEXA|nr:unnamed protein product [Allacma fusca]
MLRIAVLAILVAVASANLQTVQRVATCGSKGEVLAVRISGCATLPCNFFQSQTYQIEVDFKPSTAHSELEVALTAVHLGKDISIVKETVPAVLSPANAYTLSYPWTVEVDFTGLIILRIQLSGNDVSEICSVATANIRDIIF